MVNSILWWGSIALIIATQCIVNRGKLTFNLNKYKLWSLSFLLISSCSLIYSINRSDSLNLLKMLLILVIVMIYIESELKNLYSIEKMIMLYVIGVGTTLIYVLLTQDLNQFQLAIHGEASTGRWNGNEIGMNAAIYSVYNIVVAGVKQLLLSMTNGIQSLIGELIAKKEYDELNNIFGWVEWTIHTGTVFVFGVTALLIVPFVQIYTHGITDANYIQPLFAALIVLANAGHCLRLPYNIVILAGGHYKQTQKCYIIAALLNIIISVVAVNKLGLIGVTMGTVVAMCYQTMWMAIYDSKNIIYWPLKNFLKQVVVDIVTIALMSSFMFLMPIKTLFTLSSISYISWVVLAIKVSIVSIIFICITNLICYKKYMIKLFGTISVILKKLLDAK